MRMRIPGVKKLSEKRTKEFRRRVIEILTPLGMRPDATTYDGFKMDTKVGGCLFIHIFGDTVACRFTDVDDAVSYFGRFHVNPYSGKWNHHMFAFSNKEFDEKLETFMGQLERSFREISLEV